MTAATTPTKTTTINCPMVAPLTRPFRARIAVCQRIEQRHPRHRHRAISIPPPPTHRNPRATTKQTRSRTSSSATRAQTTTPFKPRPSGRDGVAETMPNKNGTHTRCRRKRRAIANHRGKQCSDDRLQKTKHGRKPQEPADVTYIHGLATHIILPDPAREPHNCMGFRSLADIPNEMDVADIRRMDMMLYVGTTYTNC